MATALAIVLSNLRFLELPQGGSISCASIPIMALAMRRGITPAALAGLCAGLAHAVFGGMIVHPIQLLLDYGLGAAAPALAGLARGAAIGQRLAIVIAQSAQLACYVCSGAIFFSAAGTAAWSYSLAYNAAIVIPETMLAMYMLPPVLRALHRALPPPSPNRGTIASVEPRARMHVAVVQPRLPVTLEAVPVTATIALPAASRAARIDARPPAAFSSWRAHGS